MRAGQDSNRSPREYDRETLPFEQAGWVIHILHRYIHYIT